MLQDVSAGAREKFAIRGCQPKRASRRSNANNTMASTPKMGKVVKAKRAKRSGREFLQNDAQAIEAMTSAAPSSCDSSAAAPVDDDVDVMDQAPTGPVVDDSTQETWFEYVARF